MILTIRRHAESCVLEIPDRHADREVTLPNGSIELMRNLADTTINLTPSGIVGVPVTEPDRVQR